MRAVAVAALAVVWLAVAGADVAVAHTELASTSPASGAALTVPPEVIELRFTGSVTATPDSIRLFDASSRELPVGRVERVDGRVLRAPVQGDLADGTYTVAWRAVSTDAHPLSGSFGFTVGSGTAITPTTVPASADVLPPGQVSPAPPVSRAPQGERARGVHNVGLLYGVVRFFAFASLIVLVGAGTVVWVLCREALAAPTTQRWLIGAAVVLAFATAASIGLQAAYAGGVGLSGAVDVDLIRAMLDTSFGKAMLPRLGVALAAIFAVRLLPGLPLLSAALGAAMLLFTSLAGHASTGALPAVAVAVDILHLGAVSIWLGGLVVLLTVVAREAADVGVALSRFARIATVAVTVIALTGALRTWRETAGFESLLDADYGRLVIAKAALLAVILVLGSRARKVARRRTDIDEDGLARWPAVRRIVAVEAALGAVVLAVTAVLVIAAPPRVTTGGASTGAEAAGRAFTGSVHTASTQVDVRIEPASAGANDVQVRVGRHTGAVFDVPAVNAALTSEEGTSVDVTLARVAPGTWEGDVAIPERGKWELTVTVRPSPTTEERANFTVIVL